MVLQEILTLSSIALFQIIASLAKMEEITSFAGSFEKIIILNEIEGLEKIKVKLQLKGPVYMGETSIEIPFKECWLFCLCAIVQNDMIIKYVSITLEEPSGYFFEIDSWCKGNMMLIAKKEFEQNGNLRNVQVPSLFAFTAMKIRSTCTNNELTDFFYEVPKNIGKLCWKIDGVGNKTVTLSSTFYGNMEYRICLDQKDHFGVENLISLYNKGKEYSPYPPTPPSSTLSTLSSMSDTSL